MKRENDMTVSDLLIECQKKISELDDVELKAGDFFDLCCDSIVKHSVTQRDVLKSLDFRLAGYGDDLRVLYYQFLIYQLYSNNIGKIEAISLPDDIKSMLVDDFERILRFAKKEDKRLLSFNNQTFLSYIEKLCFRGFPVGNQDLSLSGIPRSMVTKLGWRRGAEFARFLLFELKGNYPLYELHYNSHRFASFNRAGWEGVLYRAAQMMLINKEIKGLLGSAWFFDPVIEHVSPDIFYIQELCGEVGAKFFYLRSTQDDVNNAIKLSKRRRAAYEEGRYKPSSYMMVLSRTALLGHFDLK